MRFKKALLIIWTGFGVIMTLLGLGGVGDDMAQWARWLSALNTDAARWALVIVGLTFIFFSLRAVRASADASKPTGDTDQPQVPRDLLASAKNILLTFADEAETYWAHEVDAAPEDYRQFWAEVEAFLSVALRSRTYIRKEWGKTGWWLDEPGPAGTPDPEIAFSHMSQELRDAWAGLAHTHVRDDWDGETGMPERTRARIGKGPTT